MAFNDSNSKVGGLAAIHGGCVFDTVRKRNEIKKKNKVPLCKTPTKTSWALPTSQKSMDKVAGEALLDPLFAKFGTPNHIELSNFLAIFADASPE